MENVARTVIWKLCKGVLTLLAFGISWQCSALLGDLANMPYTAAVVGGAIGTTCIVVLFLLVVYLVWKLELQKIKEWLSE